MDPTQTATTETNPADFFAAFGITNPDATPPATTPPTETTPATETTPPAETPPANPDPANPAPGTDPAQQQQQTPDKAAHAFAEMRTKNANYERTLAGIAQLLGVTDKAPDAIVAALNTKLTEAQAQKQNVPVELLQRLQQLEAQSQNQEHENLQRNAFIGFQSLKDTFQLDDTALNNFAAELAASGNNPFEKQIDVVNEYRIRHFADLMAMAEERGKQAEIARSTQASQHSATVPPGGGTTPTDPEKINTIADLNKFFSQNS